MEYVANPHSKNMVRYGRLRPNVMVLSGDLTGSTEIAEFKQELPEQFVSMGMAEKDIYHFFILLQYFCIVVLMISYPCQWLIQI